MCPETGKPKNCGTWAEYEDGHTGSASMCNGGIYDGDFYSACPSRTECMESTLASRRHLPMMNQPQTGGTRVMGATPMARMGQQVQSVRQQAPAAFSWQDFYRTCRDSPTTIPARQTPVPQGQITRPVPNQPATYGYMGPYPTPVHPPQQYPQSMQTQFAAPIPFHAGGITPTFLPEDDESIVSRLFKNIGQGMIGSSGWHVFDLARTVDFFGSSKKH